MRKERIDTAIDYELFSRFSNTMSFLGGALCRIGFHRFEMEGLYRGNLLTHRVLYSQNRHMAYNFLALSHALWSSGNPGQPFLKKSLKNESIEIPVIHSGPSERPDAQAVIKEAGSSRVIDFTEETSLRELVTLFNMSRLLITSDCGPAHIACLSTVPILVFFGPETPSLFTPLSPRVKILTEDYACSPCVSVYNHRESPCSENLCLQSIPPEKVFSIAGQMIAETTSPL